MQAATSGGGRWAVVLILASLAFGFYGIVINDEQDQASALHNLAHGSLLVHDHPPQFYRRWGLDGAPRFPGPAPLGSTMLNLASLPVIGAVRIADSLAPLGAWLSGAAVALAWTLVPLHRRTPGARWLALGLFGMLTAGFRIPEPDVHDFEAVIALQFTNLALLGVLAWFVYKVLQRELPGPAVNLLGVAVLAGPLVFWGARLKYTILAALLTTIALWLAGEAPSVRRNLALGLVAGLAVWNSVGEGAVVCLAIGSWIICEAVVRRGDAARPAVLAACVLGVAIGLAPFFVENWAVSGNPFAASYLYLKENSAGAHPSPESGGSMFTRIVGAAFAVEFWQGPGDFAGKIVGAWGLGSHVEGEPLGVFALSPLLAFSGWTLVRRHWWKSGSLAMAVGMLAWELLLLTQRVAAQGWGEDVRLVAPLLPAVGVLAAAGLAPTLANWDKVQVGSALRAAAWWTLAGTALIVGLALARFLSYGLLIWPRVRVVLWLWLAVVGFAAALAVLIGPLLRFPISHLRSATIGGALSIPLLWTLCVGLGLSPMVAAGEHTGALLPAVESVRDHIGLLRPAGPIFLVTVNNQTVYDPSYGNCQIDPSPCPWGNPNV